MQSLFVWAIYSWSFKSLIQDIAMVVCAPSGTVAGCWHEGGWVWLMAIAVQAGLSDQEGCSWLCYRAFPVHGQDSAFFVLVLGLLLGLLYRDLCTRRRREISRACQSHKMRARWSRWRENTMLRNPSQAGGAGNKERWVRRLSGSPLPKSGDSKASKSIDMRKERRRASCMGLVALQEVVVPPQGLLQQSF